jgi:predicted DNA-binding protein
MKEKRFGETIPVRIPGALDRRLKNISKVTGLSKSDVTRMAINHGLPELEAGRLHLTGAVK